MARLPLLQAGRTSKSQVIEPFHELFPLPPSLQTPAQARASQRSERADACVRHGGSSLLMIVISTHVLSHPCPPRCRQNRPLFRMTVHSPLCLGRSRKSNSCFGTRVSLPLTLAFSCPSFPDAPTCISRLGIDIQEKPQLRRKYLGGAPSSPGTLLGRLL